ncbi:pro-MCH [Ambystoma mexicanum]|uniref:pro-MCH n=1 Tax=Ambystoma mexicanum TaxID=8296 RepID=UPI0037E71647
MVSMSPYTSLLMALALFSHGFLLSLSKSIRKAEGDEMLLDSISLGKALRSGEGAEKAMVNQLEHFKNDESNFLDEEEERSAKNLALKHNFLGHSGLNLAMRQYPYLALRGPSDSETQSLESVQERREAGEEDSAAKLPIGRRDFDMLRCMLGRVYRPCWQI